MKAVILYKINSFLFSLQ